MISPDVHADTAARPASPATTAVPAHGRSAGERARLRSDLAIAARLLPTHYPLESFIAVNPLAGLEHLPFGLALRQAGELYGAAGTLPEPSFRALYAAGRITDTDLDRALARYDPTLTDHPDLRMGNRPVSTVEVLRADLLCGTPTPAPVRQLITRSEHQSARVVAVLDAQTGKWCSAYLGAETTAWPMPGRDAGFYQAWRTLAPHDPSLPEPVRARLRALPQRADDAALHALGQLNIPPSQQRDYLAAHLTRQPGWAAHIHWHARRGGGGIDLLDYVALRLSYEALLLAAGSSGVSAATDGSPTTPWPASAPVAEQPPTPYQRARTVALALSGTRPPTGAEPDADVTAIAGVVAGLPVHDRTLIWLDAYEGHYRDQLLHQLDTAPAPSPTAERPTAQVVCCIDARSEGLRRHLEQQGEYETLGFAGFFALSIRYTDLAGGASDDLCPVLIDPAYDLTEHPASGEIPAAARRLTGLRALAGAEDSFHAAKDDLLAPFALAEAAGWAAGPLAAAKTLFPRTTGGLRSRLRLRTVPPAPTRLDVHAAMPLTDRVLYAHVALTTMGLTRGFARLVVLCGHGSSTENNPYQAALDCGACGGHRGAPNARAAAAILNDPAVRSGLTQHGIDVPTDTWFAAAEHDTATDEVAILDAHLTPTTHHADVNQLAADVTAAGRLLAVERCAQLPGAPRPRTGTGTGTGKGAWSWRSAARHTQARSRDWAQVFPEWGLAGNAAFLIGPRHLTKGLDLRRRVFLHSYDPSVDPAGTALETILTAPLVVAQWINAQYYSSTVDPAVFGAGTKTIHNVIAGIGVLAGHTGDLQLGLPQQSVAIGTELVHEPMRLLAVIHAPLDRIAAIIDRNPSLQDLTDNQWLTVAARDAPGQPWQRRTREGWQPWQPARFTPPTARTTATEERNT